MSDQPPPYPGPSPYPSRPSLTAPPDAVPFRDDPTTATRHLCTGAYVDEHFRDECLQEVYNRPDRLIAPSYGFRLEPVLAHCLRARRAALIRDGGLVGLLLLASFISSTSVVAVVMVLVFLQYVIALRRFLREIVSSRRTGTPLGLGRLISQSVLLMLGTVAAVGGAIVTAGILTEAFWGSSTGSGYDGQDIGSAREADDPNLTLPLILLLFCFSTAHALWRQAQLNRLTPGREPMLSLSGPRREELDHQRAGNTVVYSGFLPFVGSGEVVGNWSFAQRLVRAPSDGAVQMAHQLAASGGTPVTEAEREFDRPPFTAEDLVNHLRTTLASLQQAPLPEERIPGLTVTDRVFLSGTEVSELSPHLPLPVVQGVIRHPVAAARHYLMCQIVSWGGEVVTTVYVHVAVHGRSLYLELTTTALTPCREEFRIVDLADGTDTRAQWRALSSGLVDTPLALARGPLRLARAGADALLRLPNSQSRPAVRRGYDYGARIGVRELAIDGHVRSLSQLKDVVKYSKLIERRVIASVLDYLDAKNVDTTEYRARATSVLNIGAANFGSGQVSIPGSATGQLIPPPSAS